MEHLVQQAVTIIRERFFEPLTLDDLAQSVMVSKFHFLRVFSRVTGVTPGRFLTAVRLQEAKRLLLSTSLNVADISAQVGYSSTGCFTRRFTELVGLSPTQYRKLSLGAVSEHREPAPAEVTGTQPGRVVLPTLSTGSVAGVLRASGVDLSTAYVGAFDAAILQGVPASWSKACAPGRFTLSRIPKGTWYIHALAHGRGPADSEPVLLTATVGPIRVAGDKQRFLDMTLSAMDWSRPPILSALLGIPSEPAAA